MGPQSVRGDNTHVHAHTLTHTCLPHVCTHTPSSLSHTDVYTHTHSHSNPPSHTEACTHTYSPPFSSSFAHWYKHSGTQACVDTLTLYN